MGPYVLTILGPCVRQGQQPNSSECYAWLNLKRTGPHSEPDCANLTAAFSYCGDTSEDLIDHLNRHPDAWRLS